MIVAVADTHAAIWYLFSDPRLSKTASAFIDETIAAGEHMASPLLVWRDGVLGGKGPHCSKRAE
jgi:PIN domain nuclease of toxin-antitoxin system